MVSNTETSLRFYQSALGMEVAGNSENYGVEQEHLNNVFGARVRITTLRAPSGPGVEFLAPQDGRPRPLDTRANDIMHWQTTLIVVNTTVTAKRLREKGFKRGFLAQDPDGHAVRIVEGQ
ncbi:MAG: VOC family protein [Deltaproteobacteria bacterium]